MESSYGIEGAIRIQYDPEFPKNTRLDGKKFRYLTVPGELCIVRILCIVDNSRITARAT